jgi:hemoglobin
MSNQQQPRPSLYERLGGIYSIATVVDDFIDRVMTDPRLNANPAVNEAHHKVPPAGFKYLVTEMVGMATGGPQKYTGRSMADSHRDMNTCERVGRALERISETDVVAGNDPPQLTFRVIT